MDGPKLAIRLNKDGNVYYGWQRGRKMLGINSIVKFNRKTWLLVAWEGYELLEAVPLNLLPKEFDPMVRAFINKNKPKP